MRPSSHILNPDFPYTPSTSTNIRDTFNRLRREVPALDRRKLVVPIPEHKEKRRNPS